MQNFIKMTTLNLCVIVGNLVCIVGAAIQLRDLYFAMLAAITALGGYILGRTWIDREQSVLVRDGLFVFGLTISFIVIAALLLALGPDTVDRFRWLFFAQAATLGMRIKSIKP
jgi:hypothetical protein